jgi:hypothetical protein
MTTRSFAEKNRETRRALWSAVGENDGGVQCETDMSTPPVMGGARSMTEHLIPTQWKGAAALKQVHALNARCLELLARLAETERRRESAEMLHANQALWQQMDGAARARAAACPFLLLDAHFHNADWWRWAASNGASRRTTMTRGWFAAKPASELMRETLMLAWSTAGTDPRIASFLLGLASEVSVRMAALGLQDVERIAARYSRQLRPRWVEHPAFWRRLLLAAHAADLESLHDLYLYGIQLLGGELLLRDRVELRR